MLTADARDSVPPEVLPRLQDAAARYADHDPALADALAGAAAFAVECARSYRVSERRRQGLEAAVRLVEVLQPPIALETALEQVGLGAHTLSGALLTAVVGFPAGHHPAVAAVSGPADLRPGGLLHEVVGTTYAAGGADACDLRVHGHQVLVLPLRTHQPEPSALVVVLPPASEPLAYEERELLESYVDQAGLALDRALAQQDREELAVLSAREHVAREMHDLVVQRLFAAGLLLETVRDSTPEEVDLRVEAVVCELDEVIRQVRETMLDLRRPLPE